MRRTDISLLLAVALLLAACHEPDHVELCKVGTISPGAVVSTETISLPKGTAVAIKVIPIRDDDEYMDDETSVSVSCDDTAVLGLDPVDSDVGSSCAGPKNVPWNYVLYGRTVGETELHISVDGYSLHTIPVEVY